ncbi:MAG TPA: aroma-sacti cluster domain-containing protein [Gaiellaceae bacterium]|jgi:hypothetical protein|nr:aroma-sacti cluster domain-containing protein [Gaiellaceae bacterium]
MIEDESRVDALRDAGFDIKSPLPEAYEDVIEGLSDEELKALIDVKLRLDEAQKRTGPDAGPYREYFLPF